MKLQTRRREDPEINLTSLIDVVLLLVIFFMVSTTFQQEGRLRVELPRAAAQAGAPRGEPLVITVTAEGGYRVNERTLVNNARETLAAALGKEASAAGGDQPVTIRADGRSSHQAVVTAMEVAAKAGFTRVNIATVSESGGG
jgi:biopolymer transport protein ExbD